ncbi:MAG: hypothetical protein HY906_11140 [Deltaproteobacteria bacterium]|nr:hypothetical protein [Deltaproteobacteria bacterium]
MRLLSIVAAFCALIAFAPGLAEGQLTGQIITSDQPLPDPSGNTGAWVKELKKAHKSTFTKDENGNWQVHFLAFMKGAAGGNKLNVVFYDITKGKPDQVHYIEFNVTPTQKTLKSVFKLNTEDPVKAGNKYDVRLTKVVGGKEVILARVTLTFK